MPPLKLPAHISYWGKTLAAALLIVVPALVLTAVLLRGDKRTGPYEPLIAEAKELRLTYEQVAADPDRFLGKHAVWCVQNRGAAEVSYRGGPLRFTVVNYPQMPLETGSKHASCSDMLLQIKGAARTPAGSAIPSVLYVAAL